MKKRIAVAFIGLVLAGVSVAFTKMASFGVDPFQSLVTGFSFVFPISYGTLSLIVAGAMALFALILDRHYLNIGTAFNVLAVGYIIEYTHKGLLFVFSQIDLFGRIVFMILAIILTCFAAALYYEADLGVSPYDSLSLILGYTWKIIPYKLGRIITDICCIGLALLMFFLSGNDVGNISQIIGLVTIILAFCMGPFVEIFRKRIVRPWLFK